MVANGNAIIINSCHAQVLLYKYGVLQGLVYQNVITVVLATYVIVLEN